MNVLFLHAGRAWTGSARVFAAAARGLAARGQQVTFVCQPDSGVEQRLDYSAYEVLPMDLDAPLAVAALRLRRALALRLVEACFVHGEREHVLAAVAARLAGGRAAVVRRIAPGGVPRVGADGRWGARLAASGWLVSSDEETDAVRTDGARLGTMIAPPGVNAVAYDGVRPAPRSVIGIRNIDRVIACVCDEGSRARAALVLRTLAMLAPLHPDLGAV